MLSEKDGKGMCQMSHMWSFILLGPCSSRSRRQKSWMRVEVPCLGDEVSEDVVEDGADEDGVLEAAKSIHNGVTTLPKMGPTRGARGRLGGGMTATMTACSRRLHLLMFKPLLRGKNWPAAPAKMAYMTGEHREVSEDAAVLALADCVNDEVEGVRGAACGECPG